MKLVPIPHQFKDIALYNRALVHRSSAQGSNERLEFLGDSILGAVIAATLFKKYPAMQEGELTRLKAHLVRGSMLGEIGAELKLFEYIKLGESERKSGAYTRQSIMADTVEALIGAVFLDAGYQAAEATILSIFESRLNTLDPKMIEKDAKTKLQELCQAKGVALPEYVLLHTSGPDHEQSFTVSCTAFGITTQAQAVSRRAAEKEAAQLILEQIV